VRRSRGCLVRQGGEEEAGGEEEEEEEEEEVKEEEKREKVGRREGENWTACLRRPRRAPKAERPPLCGSSRAQTRALRKERVRAKEEGPQAPTTGEDVAEVVMEVREGEGGEKGRRVRRRRRGSRARGTEAEEMGEEARADGGRRLERLKVRAHPRVLPGRPAGAGGGT